MEEELELIDSEMTKSGSVACLSKQTVSTTFECTLSCIILVSFIYIVLLILGLSSVKSIDTLFYAVGYISIIIIISVPIGLYGSSSGSFCALFVYFILASYHLYALIMYFWFNIRSAAISIGSDQNQTKGYEILHLITTGTNTALVALSILMASLKIISNTNQIEQARVIVVDNNPLD